MAAMNAGPQQEMCEVNNAIAAISINTHPTSCHNSLTAADASRASHDQIDAEGFDGPVSMESGKRLSKVEGKPFRIMSLIPEIRANVFEFIYIQHIDQIPAHRRSLVRDSSFPHLTCNLHLVCRLLFTELVSFVACQPKVPANINLPHHTTREHFDGIVTKRLMCPAVGEVNLKYDSLQKYGMPNYLHTDRAAELMLFGVYYIQQLQPSIPKLTIALRTKGHRALQAESGRPITYRYESAQIIMVDLLTMKLVVQGSLAHVVQPELEQALGDYRDTSNTTTKKYGPFIQWLKSNKGRAFGALAGYLRSWESTPDPRIKAFLAKQRNGGKFFGLSAIDKFNVTAPARMSLHGTLELKGQKSEKILILEAEL